PWIPSTTLPSQPSRSIRKRYRRVRAAPHGLPWSAAGPPAQVESGRAGAWALGPDVEERHGQYCGLGRGTGGRGPEHHLPFARARHGDAGRDVLRREEAGEAGEDRGGRGRRQGRGDLPPGTAGEPDVKGRGGLGGPHLDLL